MQLVRSSKGGRLLGHYRLAKAVRDEARLRYWQTVLTALRDVSDALVSQQRVGEAREQRSRQVSALQTAVKLSSQRYVAGESKLLTKCSTLSNIVPGRAQISLGRSAINCSLSSLFTKASEAAGRTRPQPTGKHESAKERREL